MTGSPHSTLRQVAVVASTVGVILSSLFLSPITSAAADADIRASTVSVSVLSISPSTPAVTSVPKPLVITVSLENTTDSTLRGVTVSAERGDAIGTQDALTASLADSRARTGGKAIAAVKPASLVLLPHVPVTTTFRTTTSIIDSGRLCLCLPATVYPVDLSAQTTVGGAIDVLGGTRTYVPAFDVAPAVKTGVTWIWPLVDRPHRAVDGAVFTDDDLAVSIDGGRLDRALNVVELVERAAPTLPITLVVDPELLDELHVMSLGTYSVQTSTGALVKGLGQQAAIAWLARLRTLLDAHPVDVQLTPLADPDVTTLTQHHRTWVTTVNAQVAAGVTQALGGHTPERTVAWPPTNTATTDTLDRLAAGGATTVVLDGSQVRPSSSDGVPVSSARLATTAGTVTALLTAPVLQHLTASAMTGSTQVLPQLMAELAVRVAQRRSTPQDVVLTAPRYVDPSSPQAAAETILSTSTSLFSQPVSVDDVVSGDTIPTTRTSLRRAARGSLGLSSGQLDTVSAITRELPTVRSLIAATPAGVAVLNTLPDALQRTESAAWSPAGAGSAIGGGPVTGAARAGALHQQLSGYLSSVTILRPRPNSYTLSSKTSPLPITVRNDSALTVQVMLSVKPVGGLPGFSAPAVGVKTIGPNTKVTFKVPTHVERSGRIPVRAVLRAPNGAQLGAAVQLSVHSTVLGTIGVVITIVAGVVLVVALLVRYVRRVIRIRTKRASSSTA